MKALLAAIMTKTTGSAFSTGLGGRIYESAAPEGATFPYAVFKIIGGIDLSPFADTIDDVRVQWSLFSTSTSPSEVGTAYANLTALFDNTILTITGDTCLRCVRIMPPVTMFDHIVTAAGEVGLRHWAVDYRITVKD